MTYRLMAEMATDLVCKKMSIDKACETAELPLPGAGEKSFREVAEKIWENPTTVQKAAAGRLGTGVSRVQSADSLDQSLICECEEVSVGEINSAIERLDVSGLTDLRRRTRVVGTFPDGNSALMLVCARLRHVAGTQWGNKKYMNMKYLKAALEDASVAG